MWRPEGRCISREDQRMDPDEEKALADIEKYGCHIIHVMAEGEAAPFSYSIGIWRSTGAPELVEVGLKPPIAQFAINEYNRRVRSGERFEDGQFAGGFLEGFDCLFREVDRAHYRDYLGWARWLYRGNDFPTLQLVYPTTSGVWPWQPEASEWFRRWQTLLVPPPNQ